ncbi:MAG TPA: glycoside hydrolase family 28 protein [Verrucomicrobiae bacterium]|nr:glycoside hydrolase family 28 protein [Verrucomicrobiae bacterium]
MRIVSLCIFLLVAPVARAETNAVFDVRTFGATGDGKTKDTAAFQKALDACAAASGGTVNVTAGVYLLGSIVIGSNTTLHLDGRASLLGSPDVEDYPVARVRWEGEYAQGHRALISAEKADHIAIKGRGYIFGPPITLGRLRNPRGPALIELAECKDIKLEGFTTQYEQLWSIHPVLCQQLVVSNLTIRSVASNGDGIDVDSCQDVLIEHCSIDTGDDAIALKSGRGLAAIRLGRPTEDVVIKDCSLVSSIFAGLAIGSELSGGIRNIHVENCLIKGRQNGISFKSRDGRGGFIENFTGENLLIDHSPTFIDINLLNKGIQASDPVTNAVDKWTSMRNVRFHHVRVINVTDLVRAKNIPPERPVDGLTLTDIKGTCTHGLTLANMTNVALSEISVTGYEGPLVTSTNVHGTGLEETK